MSTVNLNNSAPIKVFEDIGGGGSGNSGLFIIKLIEEEDPEDVAQLKYCLNKNFEEIWTAIQNGLIPFLVDDTHVNANDFFSYGPLIRATVNASQEYKVIFRDPNTGEDVEFYTVGDPTEPLYKRIGDPIG